MYDTYTIYAIQNKINKKLYIGITRDPKRRLKKHLNDLKGNRHIVGDLQEDFNRFGDVFELFILEENVSYRDDYTEYKYMRKYRTCERKYGYNYNDPVAKRINFDKPKEIACKTEAEILPSDSQLKIEYISTIIEHLNKTEDFEIFEIVLQLLKKGSNNLQKG